MTTIKLSLTDSSQRQALISYVEKISADIAATVQREDLEAEYVKVKVEPTVAKAFLDRIIEDYMTLGFEVDQLFDFNEMVVYTSDNELNHYFLCQRANVNQSQFDPMADLLAECASDVKHSNAKLDLLDTLCVYNGTYKMRKILGVLIDSLETNGIFVQDDIQNIVTEKLH